MAGFAVGVVSFFVYLRTLSPGMQLGDGTELAACAYVLGVPHPTGYPLYMLLLKLWLLITVQGEVIVRTTLFNAVTMAAAAALVTRISFDSLAAIFPTWREKSRLLAATAAGLSTAFLRFHWQNAVVTEVYALEFLLMLLFLRATQQCAAGRSMLAALALVSGLGLAHHRMTVFLLLPLAWLSWRWWKQSGAGERLRTTALCAALLLLPLLLYAYLPLRAGRAPLHWGNTRTLAGFIEHVRGSEYLTRSFLRPGQGRSFTLETYATFAGRETAQILADFAGQLAPVSESYYYDKYVERIFLSPGWRAILVILVLAPFAVYGALRWLRAEKETFVIAALISAQNILVLYVYNILDIRDYYLFPMAFAWLCTYTGLLAAAEYMGTRRRIMVPAGAYICLLAPAIICAGNFHRCDQSGNDSAEVLSETVLPNRAPDGSAKSHDLLPGAILLTGSDFDTFTCWYRQYVRKERVDVLIFASNFIWKSWYPLYFTAEQTQRYHLKFAPAVASDVAQYAQQLSTGVIDANVETTPIYTSITDLAALQELAKKNQLLPIRSSWSEQDRETGAGTTVTLYKIEPRL